MSSLGGGRAGQRHAEVTRAGTVGAEWPLREAGGSGIAFLGGDKCEES